MENNNNITYHITISLALILGGCSSVPSRTQAIDHIGNSTTYSYCKAGAVDPDTKEVCPSSSQPYYQDAYNSAAGNCQNQKKIRNQILLEQMRLIDDEYRANEKDLSRNVDYKNFAVHFTSLALSGVSTLVGGASTKAILAAVDTGLKGTNTTYDNDVLHNKALAIIKNQMRKDRAVQSLIVKAKMQDEKCNYTIEEGIDDLGYYRHAGTVENALTNLENQTGAESNKLTLKDEATAAGSQEAIEAKTKILSDVLID